MIKSTLTSNGRTTVPKPIREALGIKSGQRLQWRMADNGSVSVRAQESALPLHGSLKTRKKFQGIRSEKSAVRGRVAGRTDTK
jgi:antitoxin PrlF